MYGDPRGVIVGHLYKVWEVYGDPRGVIVGCLYEVWEVYGDPRWVIWGPLFEVWEVYGDPRGVIGGPFLTHSWPFLAIPSHFRSFLLPRWSTYFNGPKLKTVVLWWLM